MRVAEETNPNLKLVSLNLNTLKGLNLKLRTFLESQPHIPDYTPSDLTYKPLVCHQG